MPADQRQTPMNAAIPKTRFRLGWWTRLIMGLGLLTLLTRLVNWEALAHLFVTVNWGFVWLALLLKGVTLLLSGLRWHYVLRAEGTIVPLFRLVRHYWVMLFFNNFIPTMVGADALRVLMLTEATSTGLKIVSVLVERLFGLVALLSLAALALLARPELLQYTTLAFAALAALGATAAVLCATLMPELWWWAVGWTQPFPRIWRLLSDIYSAGRRYRTKYRTLLVTALISTLIQLIVIFSFGLRAKALGLEIGLVELCLTVPVTVLLTLIPITPGGWGTQEGLYILIFGSIGVTAENALAVALLSRALDVSFSALGGLIWASGRGLPPGA